jgi:hypothetical protein
VRTGEIDAEDAGKLRRVKTVDFEETVSRKLEPLLNIWTDDLDPELSSQSQRLKPQVEESNAVLKSPTRKLPTCPGLKTKGRPADTAITRTDVHIL